MDVSRRRAGARTSVVAGSVWESRMKLDQVKGGIKVFNGEANSNGDDNARITGDTSAKSVKRSPIGKRKTWKSEIFDGPIQIAKGSTDSAGKDKCRELSVSVDGGIIKKNLLLSSGKGRSDANNYQELAVSIDGTHRSPIPGKKGGSEATDENEKTPLPIRKGRSDMKEVIDTSGAQLMKVKSDSVYGGSNQSVVNKDTAGLDSGIENNTTMLKKSKAETDRRVFDESVIKDSSTDSGIKQNPPAIEENGSEESCKEFSLCQEQVISSSENIRSSPRILVGNSQGDAEFDEERSEEEEMEIKAEIMEKKNVDIVEIKIPEEKPRKKVETEAPPAQQPKPNNKKVEFIIPEHKPKNVVAKEDNRQVYQFRNRAAPPTTLTVNKQSPSLLRRGAIYDNFSKPTSISFGNDYQNSFSERRNKLQSIVDLVMWRDISRSAFVFGIGTFLIISSSYTNDLNVSFISVISYLGLVYLALIFLYRSLIQRGVMDIDDTRYAVGEEEAIWLLKSVLPYMNECLLNIRALFSGDPATTMKMAVLLFIFARCGSSITIWKMAKLGFFGAFTVPKVCSSYSTQLTAYAKFWMRRFRDAWESCSHKKAVALAVFTLFWNLSSMVARIWAVFMMYVAVRYYQELNDGEDWVVQDDDESQKQAIGNGTASVQVNKVKKWS